MRRDHDPMAEPILPGEEPGPELLLAVRRGDAGAIDRWFRTEHPVVFRLCFGFLAERAEAEDTAQDTMLHLLDHLGAWDPARPYPPWRDAVVLNRCRDRLRRSTLRRSKELVAASEAKLDHLPDPTSNLERAEVERVLRSALASLSPREREAFVLRDLEGRATSHVAETMGVEEASVRSLLTLARRRLRGLIGARMGLEGDPR